MAVQPDPGEMNARRNLFDAELASARAARAEKAAIREQRRWLFLGLLIAMLGGFLRAAATHPLSPFPLQTPTGDLLFRIGFMVMLASPAICFAGAVGAVFLRRGWPAIYIGLGIGVGTGLLGLLP